MIIKMEILLTIKDDKGNYIIMRPSRYEREYHGNGKNAWYGQTEEINGHTVEQRSRRYSYRWHKTQVFFDGKQLLTSADYRRAEEILNRQENT